MPHTDQEAVIMDTDQLAKTSAEQQKILHLLSQNYRAGTVLNANSQIPPLSFDDKNLAAALRAQGIEIKEIIPGQVFSVNVVIQGTQELHIRPSKHFGERKNVFLDPSHKLSDPGALADVYIGQQLSQKNPETPKNTRVVKTQNIYLDPHNKKLNADNLGDLLKEYYFNLLNQQRLGKDAKGVYLSLEEKEIRGLEGVVCTSTLPRAPGKDVEKILRANPSLPIKERANISLSMAMEINNFHQFGLVHRDLKLANILYDSTTGKSHLIDFATVIKTGEKDNTHTGTLHYQAPERQLKGDQAETGNPAGDWFSYGVMLAGMWGIAPEKLTKADSSRSMKAEDISASLATQGLSGAALETLTHCIDKLTSANPEDRTLEKVQQEILPALQQIADYTEKLDKLPNLSPTEKDQLFHDCQPQAFSLASPAITAEKTHIVDLRDPAVFFVEQKREQLMQVQKQFMETHMSSVSLQFSEKNMTQVVTLRQLLRQDLQKMSAAEIETHYTKTQEQLKTLLLSSEISSTTKQFYQQQHDNLQALSQLKSHFVQDAPGLKHTQPPQTNASISIADHRHQKENLPQKLISSVVQKVEKKLACWPNNYRR